MRCHFARQLGSTSPWHAARRTPDAAERRLPAVVGRLRWRQPRHRKPAHAHRPSRDPSPRGRRARAGAVRSRGGSRTSPMRRTDHRGQASHQTGIDWPMIFSWLSTFHSPSASGDPLPSFGQRAQESDCVQPIDYYRVGILIIKSRHKEENSMQPDNSRSSKRRSDNGPTLVSAPCGLDGALRFMNPI